MEKNFGLRVDVILKAENNLYHHVVYHNVTEVHYNYTDLLNPLPSKQTAFESDIHKTGLTIISENIIEMRIIPEKVKFSYYEGYIYTTTSLEDMYDKFIMNEYKGV